MDVKNYSNIDYSENVIETNDHASRCKLAAVNLGYYDDPYIKFMISKPIDRSSPELNRGYALRVIFLRNFIDNFIKFYSKECQIISLGCGFDTLYWHLERSNNLPNYGLIEIDFDSVIYHKAKIIIRNQKNDINFINKDGNFMSKNYKLMQWDLRNPLKLHEIITSSRIDSSLPTLILCECVLVYLDDQCISDLLSGFASSFSKSVFMNYDPMNFDDRFGKVMDKNLKEMRYELVGKKTCSSLLSHEKKYTLAGWEKSQSISMLEIYNKHFPIELRKKIDSIEFLDELNLLQDLLSHYSISFGYNNISEQEISRLLQFH